jgi:hypothetical protein
MTRNPDEWLHQQEQLDDAAERRANREMRDDEDFDPPPARGTRTPPLTVIPLPGRLAASYCDGELYDDGEGNDTGCTPTEISGPLSGPDLARHIFDLGCAMNKAFAESVRKEGV